MTTKRGSIVWLVEIDYWDKTSDQIVTLYLSSANIFPFQPTDQLRPNQAYNNCVISPGTYGRYIYQRGTVDDSESRNEFGSIIISNVDGEFNSLRTDAGFDNRDFRVYRGYQGYDTFREYSLFFRGKLREASFVIGNDTVSTVEFVILDKADALSRPFQNLKFAGTNSGSTGLEGTSFDLKDRPKPRTFGYLFNMAPTQVNSVSLTFQTNSMDPDVSAYTGVTADGFITAYEIRDNGVVLSPDTPATYLNEAALLAATITASTYATVAGDGLFRLGSSPAGVITGDFKASGSGDTLGGLLYALAREAGYQVYPSAVGWSLTDKDADITIGSVTTRLTTSKASINSANAGAVRAVSDFKFNPVHDRVVFKVSVSGLAAGDVAGTRIQVGVCKDTMPVTNPSATHADRRCLAGNGSVVSSAASAFTSAFNVASDTVYIAIADGKMWVGTETGGGGWAGDPDAGTGEAFSDLTDELWYPVFICTGGGSASIQADLLAFGDFNVILDSLTFDEIIKTNYNLTEANLTELATDYPFYIGIQILEETTYRELISRVCDSAGAAWWHDQFGNFKVKILNDPAGDTPVFSLPEVAIDSVSRIGARGDIGQIPISRATLRYRRNWNPQDPDAIAGSVTAQKRIEFGQEFLLEATPQDSTYDDIREDHPMAREYRKDTLVYEASGSWGALTLADEAMRYRDLFGVPRDFLMIEVDADDETLELDLMDCIAITCSKAGYPTATNAYIIGISENDPRPGKRTLELFI